MARISLELSGVDGNRALSSAIHRPGRALQRAIIKIGIDYPGNVASALGRRSDNFRSAPRQVINEKEERRQRTAEDFRAQFKGELSRTASTGTIGWLTNLLAGNPVGIISETLALFRVSNRRALAQRWRARKRTYWFATTPDIPRKWKRKKGYAIRADTLAEAKHELYGEVVRKIWTFPRGWINMIITADGTPLEFLDLDQIRQQLDPERWKTTDPLRRWGNGE